MSNFPNFSHDFPGHDDHEYVADIYDTEVRISKVGGGTVGNDYAGHWHYSIVRDGTVTDSGSDFQSGSELTHEEAAEHVASFFSEDD